MYPIEELSRALAREREEEVRRIRPHASGHARRRASLRSRLARALLQLALRLDAGVNGGMTPALTWTAPAENRPGCDLRHSFPGGRLLKKGSGA